VKSTWTTRKFPALNFSYVGRNLPIKSHSNVKPSESINYKRQQQLPNILQLHDITLTDRKFHDTGIKQIWFASVQIRNVSVSNLATPLWHLLLHPCIYNFFHPPSARFSRRTKISNDMLWYILGYIDIYHLISSFSAKSRTCFFCIKTSKCANFDKQKNNNKGKPWTLSPPPIQL
jgi:hypothetical protein